MARAGLPETTRAQLALILIDFINPLDFPGADVRAPAAEVAADAARRLRSRVDAMGGGASRRISQRLKPRPGDIMVLKPRHSAFYCTPLDLILRTMGCKRLILAGLATDNCIQFSAMDAYVHGYDLWVPSDCTTAESDEAWRSSLSHSY